MKKIKVNFVDFWGNFLKDDNYFYNLLKTKYDVEIDEKHPDILFFSVDYGNTRERFKYNNCLKVFYTGEDKAPNWEECDLAYTFRHSTDPREYRLPLWALHLNWFNRPYNDDRDQALLWDIQKFLNKPTQVDKPNFCAFLSSQPKGKRLEFVPKLMQYKKIDCAGNVYHNTNYTVKGRGDQKYKVDWMSSYKFAIAMENCSSLGYCTEKIIHAMFANSIPIYWGSESVVNDFNPNSFINCHAYNSDEEIIEKIKELDTDNKKYAKMLMSEPWFNNNKIPDFVQPEEVIKLISNKID